MRPVPYRIVRVLPGTRPHRHLTLSLNTRVLQHASTLDLPYFENSSNRVIIEHLQRDPGIKLHRFLMETQKAALAGFQVASLLLILVWLEPLILIAVAVLALPFLLFQHWRERQR